MTFNFTGKGKEHCFSRSFDTESDFFLLLPDPDLTRGDGIYSRYIIPPSSFQMRVLDITVKVTTSPYGARFLSEEASRFTKSSSVIIPMCCGSDILPGLSDMALKPMPYNERIVSSYMIKVTGVKPPGTYNPSRIGNLRVRAPYNTEAVLEFTSPGDDYDQGSPAKYIIYESRVRGSTPNFLETVHTTFQAGTLVNLSLTLSSYGWHFFQVAAQDRFDNVGQLSNLAEVLLVPPPSGQLGNDGNSLPQEGKENGEGEGSGKLSGLEIALIVGGILLFVLLVVGLIVFCYCRRKGGRTMGSTETKISTISDTKAPIHWSASELLQEHEKRQSIYAQSQQTHHHPQNYTNYYEKTNGVTSVSHQMTHHTNESPESSRSFRSISENNRKTSLDSMSGRRATLTDYESCSSDKTLKSAKGQTDYETCIESDQDNYRTIDSYSVLPSYRSSVPNNVLSNFPLRIPNNNSHMQYNPNVQGSLTSVNSKRRNITMV